VSVRQQCSLCSPRVGSQELLINLQVGCPCHETCGAGDSQLDCTDSSCMGEDSKCTIGPQDGCECHEEQQCPDPDLYLTCAECGGVDDNDQCIGLSNQNGLWKGCDCINVEYEGYAPFKSASDFQKAAQQWNSFQPNYNTSNIGCHTYNVKEVPTALALSDGTYVTPDELLLRLQNGKIISES
jgi:hypothetical protein